MENCNNSDDIHQCEIDGCEKLFSSENNMKKHKLTHDGEKKETEEKKYGFAKMLDLQKKYSSSSRAVHVKKCLKLKVSPQKKAKKLADGFKCHVSTCVRL